MSRLAAINLIAVFEVYLVLTFAASIYLRVRQYRILLGLALAFPNRWPKMIDLLRQRWALFLTWQTLLPVGLTFGLMLVHSLVYNFVWPTARVTPHDLWEHWVALVAVILIGGCMLWLDFDAIFNVGELDRKYMEQNLDQAEYWLRSWVAPAVRIMTFGYVNPRQMVHEEVRKALLYINEELNKMMWWWSVQLGVRLAFGLAVWLTWAWTRAGSS